jgi:hypothetical protein
MLKRLYWKHVHGSNAKNIDVSHLIEHAYTDDGCDKHFIVKILDWIVKAYNPRLPDRLRSLIIDNNIKPCNDFTVITKKNRYFSFRCILSWFLNK